MSLVSILAAVLMGATGPDLPSYLVDFVQERTLFAHDERIIVYLRLGNQSESVLKPKDFPAIFDAMSLKCGDQDIAMRSGIDDSRLREKIGVMKRNAHVDIPLDLSVLFPDIVGGGVFQLSYEDRYYQRDAHKIKVVSVSLPPKDSVYRVRTSLGDFDVSLDFENAPNHARNFALLVASGFYQDMEFFRIVRKRVIQTGDPQNNGLGGSGFPLKREFSPFLKHEAYSLGMARAEDPDSAESQFYVCLQEMDELDQHYTVFGNVVDGFDVVDRIGDVGTTGPRGNPPDKPFEAVVLRSIDILPPSP